MGLGLEVFSSISKWLEYQDVGARVAGPLTRGIYILHTMIECRED
jgi:hypothetical protein